MNPKLTIAACLSFAIALCAPFANADAPQMARPGTVNYVEGQASIGTRALTAASIGTAELQPDQSLNTEVGKAEILLTPGVFVRLGDMSSAKMISAGLLSTEMEIDQGHATVEVADLHKENELRILLDGVPAQMMKTGLYEFDADLNVIRVYAGEAIVEDGDRRVKIKGGHELQLEGDQPLKARKFNKNLADQDDLLRWTSLRASYMAEANADAARGYMYSGMGWYSDGWYWDPWFDAFAFLPGDGILFSPFGWGFYSPVCAWAAPYYYGGGYYHRFGPNPAGWGPHAHFGLWANNNRGVIFGPRGRFSGGGIHGGGFHGGGFHGGSFGGGFHGGGFGGDFHGGGFGGGGFHGGGGGGGGHH
jgi:hypothetical protein